ncbi:ArsR/SmtB family transcription factor [Angustibacter aerolatus]
MPPTEPDAERAARLLPDEPHRDAWARRFAVLGDPTRLALLLCIHHAPGIRVSDLATATGRGESTVSQALRLLRAAGLVRDRRDGRTVRYELADDVLHELLHVVQPH